MKNPLAVDTDVQRDDGDKVNAHTVEDTTMTDGTTTPSEDVPEKWWSEEEATRVRRKLDLHIIPFLFVTYLVAFLDRSNIGNAKTAGLDDSLNLSDSQYQWLLTIFYVSYVVFQFLLIGYKLFPPSLFMSGCVMLWGVASILQAAAYNWSGLMASRFFIGLAEAAYGTGIALYLSFFYPRQEIGLRFACFVVGSAIASAIAGSIAYGLQTSNSNVEKWRLIFVVEGAPTIVISILIAIFMPNSIATARFLTPRERDVAEGRLYRALIDKKVGEQGRGIRHVKAFIAGKLNVKNGLAAVKDPVSYITASLLFIVNVGYASIPVYLPTILEGMGYTSIRAQAFSAPPYIGAFLVAIVTIFISDRVQIRGVFIILCTLVGAAGYLMLGILEDDGARYGAVWLVVVGLFTFIPIVYMFLVNNQAGESKKGISLVMFGTVGQCGPILGTRLFPEAEEPYYKKGMFVSAGLLLAGCVIATTGSLYMFYRNHRGDQQMQRLFEEAGGGKEIGVASSQEKNHSSSFAVLEANRRRYRLRLDSNDPLDQAEAHRRMVDVSRHGEDSLYFRYTC